MVKNVLEKFYEWGLLLDKKCTNATRLPAFVVSVGNLSVGGRAKTPLVIDLVRFFQERGFEPVVLTRGYGRKTSRPVEIGPATTVEEAGDEPFEIYLRTRAKVLVGARRAENALSYCQRTVDSQKGFTKMIFILDDGFQHWALARDLDIVLINEKDLIDRMLPVGRLRESPESLNRADLVLNLDKDCQKKTYLEPNPKLLSKDQVMALTARAGDQSKYFEEISQFLSFSVQRKELQDHLSTELFQKELLKLPAKIDTLILGMKEAVKLFPMKELLEKKEFLNLEISARTFKVYLSTLELKWDLLSFQKMFEEKFQGLEARR
jgi:tetraacyldisaccharide 4'-kinase